MRSGGGSAPEGRFRPPLTHAWPQATTSPYPSFFRGGCEDKQALRVQRFVIFLSRGGSTDPSF